MKKTIILIIIAIAAITANAKNFYETFENMPGVTTVYVSKAMISLAGNLNMDEMDFNSLASKIDGLWVVSAEGDKAAAVSAKAKETFKSSDYESLVKVNDGDEHVDISMKTGRDGKNECIINVSEPGEATVVILRGTFTLRDIMAASGK